MILELEASTIGERFEHYRSIDSFAEDLLVSQTEPRVEQFLRQDDNRWLFAEAATRLSEEALQNTWDNPDDEAYDHL